MSQGRLDAPIEQRIVLDDAERDRTHLATARIALDEPPQRLPEQLMPEANAQHRMVGADRVRQVLFRA